MNRTWATLVAACVTAVAVTSTAAAADVAARFPDPHRVIADYPDEVQRYVAFEVLEHEIVWDVPRPQSSAAYQKNFAYGAAYNWIESGHMMKGLRSPEYQQWAKARDALLTTPWGFALVLARYGVADLAALGRPPLANDRTTRVPRPEPLTNKQILLARVLSRAAGDAALLRADVRVALADDQPFGSQAIAESRSRRIRIEAPALPESRRVIRLPAVRYPIVTASGLVLDVKTINIARTTDYLAQQTPTAGPNAGQPVADESHGAGAMRPPASADDSHERGCVDSVRRRLRSVRGSDDQRGAAPEEGPGLRYPARLQPQYRHLGRRPSSSPTLIGRAACSPRPVSFFAGVLPCTALAAMAVASGIENLINVSMDYLEVMLVPGSISARSPSHSSGLGGSSTKCRCCNRRLLNEYGPGFRRYFAQCTPMLQGIFGRCGLFRRPVARNVAIGSYRVAFE